MQEIHKARVFALYAQVAIFDAEGQEAYPEWETEDEGVAWGPRGVAVATTGDAKVEVTVFEGKGQPEGILCASGEIQVGNKGLIVGNVVSDDIAKLDWPSGMTLVSIYLDGSPGEATRVMFVLESLHQ